MSLEVTVLLEPAGMWTTSLASLDLDSSQYLLTIDLDESQVILKRICRISLNFPNNFFSVDGFSDI